MRTKRIKNTVAYVGIDNGVSGTIGFVVSGVPSTDLIPMPVFKQLDYTKKAKNIHRVDTEALEEWFSRVLNAFAVVQIIMEAPMVNPGRFQATASALRAWEATLIVVESLRPEVSRRVVRSKEWQKDVLPNVKGNAALKKASMQRGIELFPQHRTLIEKHGDADGILIAEWARRSG